MSKRQLQVLEDIIFNDWSGIGDSVVVGNGDMRNIDNSREGLARIGKVLKKWSHSPVSVNFTAVAATDVCTLSSGTFVETGKFTTGRAVTVANSGGALPTGLSAGTVYFVISISSTTFKLAASLDDADNSIAIDITGAGTGTHSITTIDPQRLKFWARDRRSGYVYGVDVNGRVWHANGITGSIRLLTGNTLTNAAGNGIAVWKNYLFVFRNALVDVYGDLTTAIGSRAWTNGWKTLNSAAGSGYPHMAISGVDDAVYWVDDRYAGSLVEATAPFAPGTSASYTYNNQALDVPQNLVLNCLAEVGSLILFGTTNETVYPWDRVSSTYLDPLDIAEKGIFAMFATDKACYIWAGANKQEPKMYITNGYDTKESRLFPKHLMNSNGSLIDIAEGAFCYDEQKLIFGMNNAFAQTGGNRGCGIWSFNPDGDAIAMEYKLSNGYGGVSGIVIDSVYVYGGVILTSWYDSLTGAYGIDTNYGDNYNKIGSYGAYVETDYRQISAAVKPRPLKQMEVILEKDMEAADGVKISYRTDLRDSFTDFLTFDYATFGANQKIAVPFLMNTTYLQLKISLTGTAGELGGSSDYDSVGVKEVRLR